MVKHGTQKKRRRGLTCTRKAKKPIGLRIANSIKDPKVKAAWDKNKSPSDNLNDLGLMTDPNQSLSEGGGVGRKQKPKGPNAPSAAFLGT